MTFFADKAREASASIPTELCELPEVVVRDSIVSPDLGTEANPIVIGDDLAPLGSASNPFVIHVDEDFCPEGADQFSSDADTEIMATPEFWENLIDEGFPAPANEGTDVGPTSLLAPIGPPACKDTKKLQSIDQLSVNHVHLGDKSLEMTENSFSMSKDCSGREAARCGKSANWQAESEQSLEQYISKTDDHKMIHSALGTSLTSSDAISQEPTDASSRSFSRNSSRGSYGAESTKRKFSHAEGSMSTELRRSERLVKMARP